MKISIHAAREGGDVLDFYEYLGAAISIHAAREGGDFIKNLLLGGVPYFNPRRP